MQAIHGELTLPSPGGWTAQEGLFSQRTRQLDLSLLRSGIPLAAGLQRAD